MGHGQSDREEVSDTKDMQAPDNYYYGSQRLS